jgi:hypothetical protein
MKSKNIQYPETRIQDQSILATVFIATAIKSLFGNDDGT